MDLYTGIKGLIHYTNNYHACTIEFSCINSLRPGDAHVHWWAGSPLVKAMTCCLLAPRKISHGQSAPYDLVVWYRYMPKHLQTLRWPTSEHFYRHGRALITFTGSRDHFDKHGLTLVAVWVSNHMPSNVWDEITFQLFSRWSLGVDKLTAPHFIMHVINYPYWRWY